MHHIHFFECHYYRTHMKVLATCRRQWTNWNEFQIEAEENTPAIHRTSGHSRTCRPGRRQIFDHEAQWLRCDLGVGRNHPVGRPPTIHLRGCRSWNDANRNISLSHWRTQINEGEEQQTVQRIDWYPHQMKDGNFRRWHKCNFPNAQTRN